MARHPRSNSPSDDDTPTTQLPMSAGAQDNFKRFRQEQDNQKIVEDAYEEAKSGWRPQSAAGSSKGKAREQATDDGQLGSSHVSHNVQRYQFQSLTFAFKLFTKASKLKPIKALVFLPEGAEEIKRRSYTPQSRVSSHYSSMARFSLIPCICPSFECLIVTKSSPRCLGASLLSRKLRPSSASMLIGTPNSSFVLPMPSSPYHLDFSSPFKTALGKGRSK